jgi:hypothetical protein
MRKKNDNTLERMELKYTKKHAQLKLKNKLRNKIHACEDEHRAYWARCKFASPNTHAAPMTIAMNDIYTLTAIAIAPTTTNVKRRSALVSSTPDIATGRTTVATISLKS